MKNRVFNFSAGPATLPEDILNEIKDELLDFNGIGSSIIEISHRDKIFIEVAQKAEQQVRNLLSVSDDYDVLFLQGGATLQFSMIPLNFKHLGATASYAEVGSWSAKAIKEASKICDLRICSSSKANNFTNIDDFSEWSIDQSDAYVHYCKNETIQGIRITQSPSFRKPAFVDMSSCLFSEKIDIDQYDFIYACAQKNFGPSGITLVIAKKELLAQSSTELPNILKYNAHAAENSMLNTPNTFGWYVAGKMFDWYEANGGVDKMEERSINRTNSVYKVIDGSDFYTNPVNPEQRSICNVVFTIDDPDLETKFMSEAAEHGLQYLKGHRSVGGMRASIYNALPDDAVATLVEFMKDFEKKNG